MEKKDEKNNNRYFAINTIVRMHMMQTQKEKSEKERIFFWIQNEKKCNLVEETA